ncbi:hypothetical protein M0R45_036431 [Rubus argutus]|uniref:BRCT domain-containing protein n=1 Tax=Rubus argutus TaxID=59490 RepID=A0AAW1VWZ0_RUBAR
MAHPIDPLGFRPPQFSEDLAWLPGWLQQHQIEQFDECINKLKGTNLELGSKDLKAVQRNTNRGNYGDTLSREEDRNRSYRLFLSGEDNSSAGFASSPENVLHFHLHLSSTVSSQCSPAQPLDASQNDLKSNRVASVELSDTSVGMKVETCSEMGLNLGGRNLLPINSIQKPMEDVGPQCLSNDKISAMHIGEKFNVRYLKATDMTAAAELSIAASEALVIHEIVRSGVAEDAFPTEMVLEAALRVKKARLEWSEDDVNSLTDETDKSDSLSDLDDLTMADAYEDVGLSQSIPFDDCACGSAISLAAIGELGYGYIKRQFASKSFNHEREESYDNLVPHSNICNVARYNHSALKTLDILTMKQTVGPGMVDVTSYQPQEKVNIRPHAWNSGNGEDRVTYVSDRFRSRWLGGWTGQEVSAVGHMRQSNKSIVKCFAGETSFLSESADIAPDMNSFVQVHEIESHRMSQSSIRFDLLPCETNKGMLLSQDAVMSSSLSLVDPLCSVVPCSIPLENEVPTLAQTPRDKKSDTDKCFRPTTELGMGNSYKSSNLIIEFHHEDGQATCAINGEDSPATVRRQFISLKTYSTLLPNPVFDGGSLYNNQSIKLGCDQRLNTLDQNVGCIRSSEKICKASLPFKPVSRHLSSRDNKEHGKIISNGTPVAKMKHLKRKNHETAGDGDELPVQVSKKRRQSVSFNHRAHRHLQASKSFVNNSTSERHPKLPLVAENAVGLQQNKELQSKPSECKSLHCRDVPAKKRVHFSEAEIPVQQNKSLKKLDFSTKNCLTDRASKKRKYSKYSKFQNHEKSCLSYSHVKAGKRLLFQGMQFLLTGFSRQKEKDLEGQIWKHGGIVLFDIPSPISREKRSFLSNGYQLPIILCSKKLQTTKFLYGCAVNAFILKDDWLTNSISADSISRNHASWEEQFLQQIDRNIKHGGGKVFKTLQRLILELEKEKISWGTIVSEDERTSRQLRHCAAERKIPILPASWIIKSLHIGKRLPFSDTGHSSFPVLKIPPAQFP